jgi:membrane-associated PAP2 superfamily phosphatase
MPFDAVQNVTGHGARFALIHVLLIPACFAAAAVASHVSQLDAQLTAWFFDPAQAGFPARRWVLIELFGYRMAKSAVVALWLTLLGAACAASFATALRPHRALLWATVAAMALGPALVAGLKDLNGYRCPWDLKPFGGIADYASGWFVDRLHVGRCFPSGHAAGGFSLIALYFAAAAQGKRRLAGVTLATALAAGAAFSVVRIAQGAHFLSHNLWSAAIDWAAAGAVFLPLVRMRKPQAD